MGVRLTKPWTALADPVDGGLPAQLGVFELGSADGDVVYLGYAGGREPFGLRTAVTAAVERARVEGWGPPTAIRYELTHGYLSRWQELLMVHLHDHGTLPPGNPPTDHPPGRLQPGGAPAGADRSGQRAGVHLATDEE